MDKIFRAIEIASLAHGIMTRKYSTNEKPVPFIVHPLRVLQKVNTYLEYWHSARSFRLLREPMLAVCALHDVVEDTDYSADELQKEFGFTVMEGLYWLTNPSKQCPEKRRAERKEMDLQHLAKAPKCWQVIKMWDRIDNLEDLKNAPKDFVGRIYIPESRQLAEVIGDADIELKCKLTDVIDQLEKIILTK